MVDVRMITHPEEFIQEKVGECSRLEDIATLLGRLISSDLSVWRDGKLSHTRARVGNISGLKIEVFPNDHDPPHFHVWGPGIDAKFSLNDCALLAGRIGRREEDLVRWFFENGGKPKLWGGWDRMHPSRSAK